MTASASLSPSSDTGRPRLAATIAIGLIASAAVFGLLVAGTVFLALAVGFETAIPIAQHYRVSVSAADMAVAARLAELWWVPGVISIASFLGALVVGIAAVWRLGAVRGR